MGISPGEGARESYLRREVLPVSQIEREGDVGFRVPAPQD
jgi:hypothetical protein